MKTVNPGGQEMVGQLMKPGGAPVQAAVKAWQCTKCHQCKRLLKLSNNAVKAWWHNKTNCRWGLTENQYKRLFKPNGAPKHDAKHQCNNRTSLPLHWTIQSTAPEGNKGTYYSLPFPSSKNWPILHRAQDRFSPGYRPCRLNAWIRFQKMIKKLFCSHYLSGYTDTSIFPIFLENKRQGLAFHF